MRPISLRAPVAVTRAMRVPLHDQRAGIDPRQIVAAGRNACRVGWRAALTASSSLCATRLPTGTASPVSSDSSTRTPSADSSRASAGTRSPSLSLQQVAAHHVAAGDALGLAVADHQRARAGQVAQGFDGALGLALLVQREPERDDARSQRASAPPASHRRPGTGCRLPAAAGTSARARVSTAIDQQGAALPPGSAFGPSSASRCAASAADKPGSAISAGSGGCASSGAGRGARSDGVVLIAGPDRSPPCRVSIGMKLGACLCGCELWTQRTYQRQCLGKEPHRGSVTQ